MVKSILSCVDGSEHSLKALDYAVHMANSLGAKLTVAEVVEVVGTTTDSFIYPAYYSIPVTNDDMVDKIANERLEKLLPALGDLSQPFDRKVVKGDAATEILELLKSKDYDLVIMGTHGRNALTRFLVGSVSDKVVHHSPVPVLVVR